ncbi:MAG TPA: translation initiation factor IF-1 [Candidatus Binatia bacterium]|nr:translation initiation factor IF-1 [Candidatus Binatia bacterium]
MSRDDLVRVDGVVTGLLGGGSYSVDLLNGNRIVARRSGRLRKFHIRIMPGDSVTVGVSPYDVSHGLIVTRR